MQNLNSPVWIFFGGIILVIFIDVAGSLSSRKYRFNYGYFAVFSTIVYAGAAFLLYQQTGDEILTHILVLLLGFFGGTVGWKISKRLKAYYGQFTEQAEKINDGQAILAALFFAFICGWVGIILAG